MDWTLPPSAYWVENAEAGVRFEIDHVVWPEPSRGMKRRIGFGKSNDLVFDLYGVATALPSYRIVLRSEQPDDLVATTMTAAGMSLRDWFAGQALAGLSSATDSTGTWQTDSICASERAYAYADAMLAVRAASVQPLMGEG